MKLDIGMADHEKKGFAYLPHPYIFVKLALALAIPSIDIGMG